MFNDSFKFGGPPNHITKDFLTPFLTGATLCLKNDAKNMACPCFKGNGLCHPSLKIKDLHL